jgi:hypothetical protein
MPTGVKKHFAYTMRRLLPEKPEDGLKSSRLPPSLQSLILTIGMVLAIACAFPLPVSAETPDNALETKPLFLNVMPSLLSTTTVTAEKEKPTQVPFKQEEVIQHGPAAPTFLDTIQAGISNNMLQSAQWLDSFFYDRRYIAEENRTHAAIRCESFIEEHAPWTFKTKLQMVLVLPQLKNKANIVIAGDPNEDNPDQLGQGPLASPAPINSTNRNSTAALGYQFRSDERRNINAKVGFRYRNGHIVLFIRPHYRKLNHLDGWDLRFTQEFPYWTDTKWSSSTTIDLERPLGNKFFFRTSLNGSWYEQQPGYTYGLLFTLAQPLSTVSALSYDLGASFQTGARNAQQTVPLGGLNLKSDPGAHDILTTVAIDTRYRRLFWRDWMYFDITPQVRFPRDRRFNPVPGIMFALEVQFGKNR